MRFGLPEKSLGKTLKTPSASSLAVRKRMQSTRQRNTPLEMRLRSILHNLGLRFVTHRRVIKDLPRTADIVFRGPRLAIFVDGCFWHGCPVHGTTPTANRNWWSKKIATNRQRDHDTVRRIRSLGWEAIRIWGHEDPQQAALRIATVLKRQT